MRLRAAAVALLCLFLLLHVPSTALAQQQGAAPPNQFEGAEALDGDLGGAEALEEDPGGAEALEEDPGGAEALDEDLEGLDDLQGARVAGDASRFRIAEFRGYAASEGRFYLLDHDASGRPWQLVNELRAEFDLAMPFGFRLFVHPRFLLDASDTELHRYEPLEAYVTFERPRWSVRAGQFVESWGIADAFNPVDVLNRRDLGADVLDPPALGELGLRLRFRLPGGAVFGQPVLSLYALPLVRSAPFPTPNSRFALATPNFTLDEDGAVRPAAIDQFVGVWRLEHTLSTGWFSADLQYLFYRGPDRSPSFEPQIDAAGIRLVPVYFGNLIAGGGFRAVPKAPWWSKLTLKLEMVYKRPYRIDGLPSEKPEPYLQYAAGFDRQFNRVFTSKDQLTLTVEFMGEHLANDRLAQFRPFDRDLAVRFGWEANNFSRSRVELRAIVDLRNGELIGEGSYQQQLRPIDERLRVLVLGQLIKPERDGTSFFGFFPNNSNLRVELRYDFSI